MTESSVGSRLTALNTGRAGSTSRSSQRRATANGGATAQAAACRASSSGTDDAADHRAEGAGVERQHDVPRLEHLLVGLDAPPGRRVQRPHRSAGAHLHPAALQVRPQRRPDAGQVVGVGSVEPDALRVAEEVVVEHRDQLARRQRGGPGEERTGEGLEQHRLRAVGHAELGEEPRGGHVIERGRGGGARRRRAVGPPGPGRSRRGRAGPRLGERAKSAIRLSGGAPGRPVRSSGGQLREITG